jgi:hypothetical protein
LATKSKSDKTGLGQRLVQAVAHPIRLEALRIFYYRTASPNEVAKELGVSLGRVAYHVRVLKGYGCIETIGSRPVRGATEHFYRATVPPHFEDEEWKSLPRVGREDVSAMALQGVIGELVRACQEHTFDARTDRHLSWVPLEVDEQGWRELVGKQLELLEEVMRIKAESAERLLGAEEPGQRVVAATFGFETPPGFGFVDPERHGVF